MSVGAGFGKVSGESGLMVPSRLTDALDVNRAGQVSRSAGRLARGRTIGYSNATPRSRQTWELHRARDVSRQLALTSPHWRAFIKWMEGQAFGKKPSGLTFPRMPKDGRQRLDGAVRDIRQRWREHHYETIGMRGENLLYLRANILYHRLVDGDCFIIPRPGPDGRPRYQFFPGDSLAETTINYGSYRAPSRALGIETDVWGKPTRYFFSFQARARPVGWLSWSGEVDPVAVPAENVWHFRERFEDDSLLRSYPWCTAAIDYIKMLHEYRQAFVTAAVARARIMVFLETHPELGAFAGPDPDDQLSLAGMASGDDSTPAQAERFWEDEEGEIGEIMRLRPGYRATRMDPGHPTQNEYMELGRMEEAVCAALRTSPMALLARYSGVSFSSAQAAGGQERSSVEGFQAWIAMAFLDPVYRAWLAAEWPSLMMTHDLRAEDYETFLHAAHSFKAYQPLEKHRIIKAVLEAWQGGLYTMAEAVMELGLDGSDIAGRIEQWKLERREFGLSEVPEGAGKAPAPEKKEYDPEREEKEEEEAEGRAGNDDPEEEGE